MMLESAAYGPNKMRTPPDNQGAMESPIRIAKRHRTAISKRNITGNFWTVAAPSNIAFLKYWGKSNAELQWPANDSLSMTLSSCCTVTTALLLPKQQLSEDQFYYLNDFSNLTLEPFDGPARRKTLNHLQRLKHQSAVSHLFDDSSFLVVSTNTFPKGCGIASSASGFAALTLATVWATCNSSSPDVLAQNGFSREVLEYLARMGSGSATRSLYGGIVGWSRGTTAETQMVNQFSAFNDLNWHDIVIIVSDVEKTVSSSEAHKLAWTSPLFPIRLAGLSELKQQMLHAIGQKSLSTLGPLLEREALDFHSVAMTSEPSIRYMTAKTIEVLTTIREARSKGELEAWFTLDAGANVHLICDSANQPKAMQWLTNKWPDLRLIEDRLGQGPYAINPSALEQESLYV
jgi:diphosphomevalonate decarboxylase